MISRGQSSNTRVLIRGFGETKKVFHRHPGPTQLFDFFPSANFCHRSSEPSSFGMFLIYESSTDLFLLDFLVLDEGVLVVLLGGLLLALLLGPLLPAESVGAPADQAQNSHHDQGQDAKDRPGKERNGEGEIISHSEGKDRKVFSLQILMDWPLQTFTDGKLYFLAPRKERNVCIFFRGRENFYVSYI